MINIYHKLRDNNPESARILVRKLLKNKSVTKTTEIFLNVSDKSILQNIWVFRVLFTMIYLYDISLYTKHDLKINCLLKNSIKMVDRY